MSMTKKDFEGIATALNKVLWMEQADPLTVTHCVVTIAAYCQQSNAAFDLVRFRQAVFASNGTHVPLKEG